MNNYGLYGRDQEIKEIFAILASGQNVFVEGLRRMGKTMIVQELARLGNLASSQTTFYFYVDVGSCSSNVIFYERLCQTIEGNKGQFAQWLKSAGKKIGSIEEVSFLDMTLKFGNDASVGGTPGRGIIAALDEFSHKLDCNIVLILDEYPLMLWNARKGNANDIVNTASTVFV